MSSFDYARAKASADRMIGRFGQAMTLRVPGAAAGPAYDPTPGAPTDYACTGVVTEFSTYERTAAGSRVLTKDKKLLLAKGDLPLDPSSAHTLLIDGESWRIIGPDEGLGIKTLAPAGTVVMYELQIRQ